MVVLRYRIDECGTLRCVLILGYVKLVGFVIYTRNNSHLSIDKIKIRGTLIR